MGEKTEQPTPKKLADAKKKGQIAFSKEAPAVFTFIVGMSLIMFWAPRIGDQFGILYHTAVQAAARIDGASAATIWVLPLREVFLAIVVCFLPILGGIAVTGLALSAAQAGLNLTFEPMKPSLQKLNPIEGVKRIFSGKGIIEFLKTLIKVVLVLYLGYKALGGAMETIVRLHWADMGAFYRIGFQIARSFTFQVGGLFLAVAGFDYFYQKYQWKKQLKMSKDEVKQEYKESEGDPMIKAQRKALGQAMIFQNIQQEVPKADAVVTNPTHLAIAIRYDRSTMGAPKVTAKGGGTIAKTIVQLAKKHDVPIIRDIQLAHSLFTVEMGRYIPRDMYEVVAEILLFAWRLRQEAQRVPGGV